MFFHELIKIWLKEEKHSHLKSFSIMYTRYFGLHEKPFAISPTPRYLYMSELHREALAHLLYGIDSDGCIILLTGDVGTGKTTVCRFLFEQLPKTTDTAIILNPKLTAKELLVTICDELEIADKVDGISTKTYIDAINNHLLSAHGKGQTTVVFIDEAQNLNVGVLEQLRLLTNLETDKHKLLKIVLIGQPELRAQLERPEATQINQRVTSRYHLQPLNKADVLAYIQHRLEVAGGGKTKFFTERALKRIYLLSKGIPRLINIICDRALLGAYAENKHCVDIKIVNQAALEVLGRSGFIQANRNIFHTIFSSKSLLTIVILLLLALATSLLFVTYQNYSRETSIPKQSQPTVKGPHSQETGKTSASLNKKNTTPPKEITDPPQDTKAPAAEVDISPKTIISITPKQIL